MAVLGTIVQAFMLSVFNTGHDLSLGRAVAGQFVRDHHTRSGALAAAGLNEAFGKAATELVLWVSSLI